MEPNASRPQGLPSARNLLRWILFAVFLGVLAVAYLFDRSAGAAGFRALRRVDAVLLAAGVASAFGSWVLTSTSQMLLCRAAGSVLPIRRILPAYLAGNFVGLATPFASGGAPAQAYFLSRLGVEPGRAFAAVASRGLISTTIVAATAGVALAGVTGWLPTGAAGNAAKSAVVTVVVIFVGLTLLAVSDRPRRVAASRAERTRRLWARRMWLAISSQTGEFNRSLRAVARRPIAIGAAALCEAGAWALIVVASPLVLAALGWRGPSWVMFLRTLALFLVVPFSPTPGSAGTAELAFFTIGRGLVPSALLAPAVLLWRFIVYYLPLAVGGVLFVWYGSRPGGDAEARARADDGETKSGI